MGWLVACILWFLIGITGMLACHYFLDEDKELTLGWLILCIVLGFSGLIPWIILAAYRLPFKRITIWKWK
jgi:hypothetical protein